MLFYARFLDTGCPDDTKRDVFEPIGMCCFPPPHGCLREGSQGPPVPRTARTNLEGIRPQGRRRPQQSRKVLEQVRRLQRVQAPLAPLVSLSGAGEGGA